MVLSEKLEKEIQEMQDVQDEFEKELNKIIVPQGYKPMDLSELSFYEFADITELAEYYGAKKYAQIYFNTRY